LDKTGEQLKTSDLKQYILQKSKFSSVNSLGEAITTY